jgi:hypothetical protein
MYPPTGPKIMDVWNLWMEGRTDDVEGRALARPYPVLTVLLVLSRHAHARASKTVNVESWV